MKRLYVLSVGMAMFSMFFGAGSVVFPMLVGQAAQAQVGWALLGLAVTAVGVPFVGLLSMVVFDGDYRAFFDRLGKVPGFLLVAIIMLLIGPFGALPRCVALSHATLQVVGSDIGVWPFVLAACVVIFALTVRKNRIVDVLGYVLTPLLLLALAVIVVKGFLVHPVVPHSGMAAGEAFGLGFMSGYHTMDLLATFFFCAVVMASLRHGSDPRHRWRDALVASAIGALLLGVVYCGLSGVAAFHSAALEGVPRQHVLGILSLAVLGPYAGVVSCAAVILACLTTAMALAAVFAEFLRADVLRGKLSYTWSLVITLLVTAGVGGLEFEGIMRLVGPIVEMVYPSLFVLCVANIAQKFWGFRWVKLAVVVSFAATLLLSAM